MSYKFGKLPARHDPRTYRLGPVLAARLVGVPATCDWSAGLRYDMNGNDRFGDCAWAARAAMVLTWTARAQAPERLTETQVLADYAQATGFDPVTGADDNGTILLDALNLWRRDGFARPGQTRDYLTAFGALAPTDHDAIRRAIHALGGAYVGIQVPRYLMSEGGDWAFDPAADWTPVGGHCVAALGYDAFGPRIMTWGGTRRMAWALWDRVVDEAYGLVSRLDDLTIHGVSPLGENMDALVAEMRAA
jgi:hypothetical protein